MTSQNVTALAATLSGGVVMSGVLQGTVDFGDGDPITANGTDAFVARYGASGNLLWVRVFGGPDHQGVRGMAVDPTDGSVVIGGYYHTAIAFDLDVLDGATPAAANAYVAKLTPGGDVAWSHAIGGAEGDYTNAVAVDAQGNIAFGGTTTTGLDLGQGPLPGAGDADADMWLAVYDAGGSPVWTELFDDLGWEDLRRLAFEPMQGDLVVGGRFTGSIDFGSASVSAGLGAFVAKFDEAGNYKDSMAASGVHDALGMAVDGLGNTILSGFFDPSIDAGSGAIPSVGGRDGFVLKLDPALTAMWLLSLGSAGHDDATGVTTDANGNVYALGTFVDVVSVPGCGDFTSEGETDLLLMKLAP
jgi:hypothetical protein